MAKGRLLRVLGMLVARRQHCNPAMTDNVTVRFCLRGSPYKDGDGRKAGSIKAIIERRGRGKCRRGGKARATGEESDCWNTRLIFFSPSPPLMKV